MKNKLWILGIIFTIVCVSCGVMLPVMAFSYQTNQFGLHAETYSISENQFNYTSTLTDVLNSITQNHYEIEYSEELANMTADEVFDEGISFLRGLPLDKWGICVSFEDQMTEVTTSCNLLVTLVDTDSQAADSQVSTYYDTDNKILDSTSTYMGRVANSSIVVWRVTITYDNYSTLEMLIDDQNEKVISFSYATSEKILPDKIESHVFLTDYLIPYLEKYYDLSFSEDYTFEDNDYYTKVYDDEKNEVLLNTKIFDDFISFNEK